MGRNWRSRHCRQVDRYASDEGSNDGGDLGGNGRHVGDDQLGSHTVGVGNHGNDSSIRHSHTEQRHHRPRELFQDHEDPRNRPDYASFLRHVNQSSFLLKSQRFKKQLLQSIDLTVKQLQHWCPDEDPGVDEMDWQPEAEVLLPHQAERATFTANALESTEPTPALAKGVSFDVFGMRVKN